MHITVMTLLHSTDGNVVAFEATGPDKEKETWTMDATNLPSLAVSLLQNFQSLAGKWDSDSRNTFLAHESERMRLSPVPACDAQASEPDENGQTDIMLHLGAIRIFFRLSPTAREHLRGTLAANDNTNPDHPGLSQ